MGGELYHTEVCATRSARTVVQVGASKGMKVRHCTKVMARYTVVVWAKGHLTPNHRICRNSSVLPGPAFTSLARLLVSPSLCGPFSAKAVTGPVSTALTARTRTAMPWRCTCTVGTQHSTEVHAPSLISSDMISWKHHTITNHSEVPPKLGIPAANDAAFQPSVSSPWSPTSAPRQTRILTVDCAPNSLYDWHVKVQHELFNIPIRAIRDEKYQPDDAPGPVLGSRRTTGTP
jgi:hypothetical protein